MSAGASLSILQVTPFYSPAWAYGGIPRVVYELSRRLASAGHRVTVCTTDALDEVSRSGAGESDGETGGDKGIELRRFRNLSNRLCYSHHLPLPLGMGRFLKKRAGDFDIVHLHGHRHLLNNIVLSVLRRSGAPVLFSAHGTALRIERKVLTKIVFDRLFGHRVLRAVDRFFAVSDSEVLQYLHMGVDLDRISVIHNGLDAAAFGNLPPPGTFRGKWNLGAGPLLLYLGQLSPRKGVDVLIRAAAWLPGVRLVIAGNDVGVKGRLARLARALGLEDRVLFTGLLLGAEKLAAYRDADIVVYPSVYEIFGLVPFEAMLCGTPVIVGDDCGCGDLVRDAGAGYLVRYGNAANLAGIIEHVLAHPEEAAARTRLGRFFIEKHFGWDTVLRQMLRAYRGALAEKKESGGRK